MIQSTVMYITDVQRKNGVITCAPVMRRKYPPPITIYRQDYRGQQAAMKIQSAWKKSRGWKDCTQDYSCFGSVNSAFSHVAWGKHTSWEECKTPDYLCSGSADGAFSHLHGYHPNLCATKLQAVFRGHMARVELPKKRMVNWIVNNLL